jgi:hypothetical protein
VSLLRLDACRCLSAPDLAYSYSIINRRFFVFYIQWLIFLLNGNTMKNTMLRKSFKMFEKIAD